MKLLIGAGNRGKVRFIKGFLRDLPVTCVGAFELGISLDVAETGETAEENARLKAEAYFHASRLPTVSSDAGITIEGLAEHEQPGLYVRRVTRDRDASDEEVLTHFRSLVENLGGETQAEWTASCALVTRDSSVTTTFSRTTILTSKVCGERSPGAPLQSMQLDPKTGQYLAQMSADEHHGFYRRTRGYHEFIEEHLDLIERDQT